MKIKAIALTVMVAFFSVSCGYVSMISGLVGSDKKESSSNSTKSDSSASKGVGWNKNADGSWSYTSGELPQKRAETDQKLTNYIYINNSLGGSDDRIIGVYIMAAGSSSWGDNLVNPEYPLTGNRNRVMVPSGAVNKDNKFNIRAVSKSSLTNKVETFTLTNIVVPPNGEVDIKR